MLVTQPRGILEWWDVRSMSRGFESRRLDDPILWLEFERGNSNIWLTDGKRMREWEESGDLGWPLKLSILHNNNYRWESGEGISRGLPPGVAGIKSMLHVAAWKLRDQTREVIGTAVPREADELLMMGNDGTVARQRKKGFYDKIEGMRGIGKHLATEAKGKLAIVILRDGTALLIDVAGARVFDEFHVGEG